jgi:hypothetical protein
MNEPATVHGVRRVLPVLLAACIAGCHTAAAVRQLSGPSPVKAVSVLRMPKPEVLYWRAAYGYTNSADPFIESMSDRTVEHAGEWKVPPDAVVCRRVGREFEPLQVGRMYILFAAPGAEGGATPEGDDFVRAAANGCTHILRADTTARYVRAVRLLPTDRTQAPIDLPLPEEHPTSDARRWGWLAAAPAFDVATIVALPVVAIYMVAASGGETEISE